MGLFLIFTMNEKFQTISCASGRGSAEPCGTLMRNAFIKEEVQNVTQAASFKRLIISGICQMVTFGVGEGNIDVFPLTLGWMWTLISRSSKTLCHPDSGASAENKVREGGKRLFLYCGFTSPLSSPRNELMCMQRMRDHSWIRDLSIYPPHSLALTKRGLTSVLAVSLSEPSKGDIP